jgi:Tfp pilus assembly protein PilV
VLSNRGTSLIELMIAITMLMIGVLGLIGTSALVNIYLAQGRWGSVATAQSVRRLELLRAGAAGGCTGLAGGSAALPGGGTETWTVVPRSRAADLTVVITGPPARAETLATTIECP